MAADDLLAGVLDAHGGLDNWRQTTSLTAELTLGGPFWAGRGWPVEFGITATLDTQREHIELAYPDRVATFDVAPERLTLRSATGEAIETRDEPRASFPPSGPDTAPWDAIQIAYFQCTANWNYLTAPFVFAGRCVGAHEIASWDEDGETWRRLAVLFPPSNAN